MKTIFIKNADFISRKSRSSLIIHVRDGSFREINIRDIEALVIIGSRTKIETGVVSLLSRYNIPLSIVSKLGVSILTVPVVTLYSETRRAQYSLSNDDKIELMMNILYAKFRGFINILKYHEKEVPEVDLNTDLANLDLLNWEASISRACWQSLLSLIPDELREELRSKYGFVGRKPRSRDPFNQSISALYAVLYAIATRALLASGLDPTYGLHHKTRYSTPLVYDYVEMFKPIPVHTVIRILRKTEKLPELDRNGYLKKKSLQQLLKEFFKIMNSRIRGTKITPHRAIYINAYKLTARIKTSNKEITYTFIYNPKKLIYLKDYE